MQTVGEVIQRHAFAQPDRPAIVTTGKNLLSYERLQWHVQEIGLQLRRAGFGWAVPVAQEEDFTLEFR